MVRARGWAGAPAAALLALAPAVPGAAERVRSVFAGADPFAMAADGQFWIYPTGSGRALDAWSSPDLVHWRDRGALVRLGAIGWIGADGARDHQLWAPDMIAANGRYYFYYAVGPQNPTPSRIGVAACVSPAGPCTDSGQPLLTGGDGFEAIDPMVFVDPKDGTRYLLAGGSAGATLRAYILAPDMERIERRVAIDQPPCFTEGVFLHEYDGLYYLSWSSGHWNRSDYSVRYATGPSPLGPWTYRGVLLASDGRYEGPGHHAFLRDPRDGSWWIVYHRWEDVSGAGPYTGRRRVAIQRIHYLADGRIAPISMEPGDAPPDAAGAEDRCKVAMKGLAPDR